MTNLILALAAAFFGLNTAIVAYIIVRLSANAFWALTAFNVVLIVTCFGVVQIAST